MPGMDISVLYSALFSDNRTISLIKFFCSSSNSKTLFTFLFNCLQIKEFSFTDGTELLAASLSSLARSSSFLIEYSLLVHLFSLFLTLVLDFLIIYYSCVYCTILLYLIVD